MRSNPQFGIGLFLALLALFGCPDESSKGPEEPPQVAVDTLGWVHVEDGRLMDEFGRQWFLRGVNARIEGIFDVSFDDGREPLEPIPDFAAVDAIMMADLGFNILRLPINWSGLEPVEGQISEEYLQRVDDVIEWCRLVGVYVLVDFHQDAYSKEIGEDGAPLWAIVPEPTELLGGPLHDLNSRRASQQVLDAFESFYRNEANLQDRFMPAWRTVVERYANDSHVIGFELMNEPTAFYIQNGLDYLYDFYERAAVAMREVNARHTLWLEPDAIRNFIHTAPRRSSAFPDANVVYSPHLYPALSDFSENTMESYVAGLEQNFDWMVDEAESWGAALVIGEWGIHPNSDRAGPYVSALHRLVEDRLMGEVFWLWKEHTQGWWGLFDYDGETGDWSKRETGIRHLATPYAMAVPGRLTRHRFDREAGVLTVEFTTIGGEAAPLLYIPHDWYPDGVEASLTSASSEERVELATGRVLFPWQGAKGSFILQIQPLTSP